MSLSGWYGYNITTQCRSWQFSYDVCLRSMKLYRPSLSIIMKKRSDRPLVSDMRVPMGGFYWFYPLRFESFIEYFILIIYIFKVLEMLSMARSIVLSMKDMMALEIQINWDPKSIKQRKGIYKMYFAATNSKNEVALWTFFLHTVINDNFLVNVFNNGKMYRILLNSLIVSFITF